MRMQRCCFHRVDPVQLIEELVGWGLLTDLQALNTTCMVLHLTGQSCSLPGVL